MASRVNMILTPDAIRYGYQASAGASKLSHIGETVIPEGIFKQGLLVDKIKFKKLLEEVVKANKKFRSRDLALTLIDDAVYTNQVVLPGVLDVLEAAQYIRTQAGVGVDIPFEKAALSLDILKYNERKGETHVMYYAYPDESVQAIIEVFKSVHFRPVIIDLSGPNVARYATYINQYEPVHQMVVQWHKSGLYVSVYNKGRLKFTRMVKQAIMPGAKFSEIKTMIETEALQVSRLIEYYQTRMIEHSEKRGTRRSSIDYIERVVLSGDFEYIDTAVEVLKDTLDVPVYTFDDLPLKKLNLPDIDIHANKHGRSTRSAAAYKFLKYIDLLGLSIRSVVHQTQIEVPRQKVDKKAAKKQKKGR